MTTNSLSFLSGANADFIAELLERYNENPASVDPSWREFLGSLQGDATNVADERAGTSWSPSGNAKVIGAHSEIAIDADAQLPLSLSGINSAGIAGGLAAQGIAAEVALRDSIRALMFIRAYRACGHLKANLDPLGIAAQGDHPELNPLTYGFSEADMHRPIYIDGVLGLQTATLAEIEQKLKETYAGNIGVEFMHILDPAQKKWVQERMENSGTNITVEERKHIFSRLTAAESFEKFLHTKFPSTKRFGLEGAESMIPALEEAIAHAASMGLSQVVIGMAHRGRLNVLTNLMNKSFTAMFSEFQGTSAYPDSVQGSGDVKYHLGTSTDREFNGYPVHLSLLANPSHLEWVDPVVIGRVRAKQQRFANNITINDTVRRKVMGLLIHGDSSFAGQGVVAETFLLSVLKGYATGGTLHFVINNQIGFTTGPHYTRPGTSCTDIAKTVQAPIFRVNGDDPEAVVRVTKLAAEFRQTFFRDVVVDMVCYRRRGHNEGDEPSFTQPIMYKRIADIPTTRAIHADRLISANVLTADEASAVQTSFLAELSNHFEQSKGFKPNKADWLEGRWKNMVSHAQNNVAEAATGIDAEMLREIGQGLARIPAGFNAHPKVLKLLEARRTTIEDGEGIDWATAEALAFGSLAIEGTPVRLSGQDSARGTFSQRHAKLYDQETEARCVPLNSLRAGQASFEVHNSPLSEAAVLGFDYGFSLAGPNVLVCWEAQFGDFANGAQIIIDQFISAAESKWLRFSGLVMLLPHGYEGQGSEHSSARLERFLQLCAEDNWQVANCSTPANYFHILRRQIHRPFRKPLILMTPKSLLRHKMCVSKLNDFATDTKFLGVIPETANLVAGNKVRRVLLCSGKVYYDLLQARIDAKITDVAIIRVEQLYPFPHREIAAVLSEYPKAEIVWCQEEPKNMGAWTFIDRRLEDAMISINHASKRPIYVGRSESASPATGSFAKHTREQNELIAKALG